MPMCEGVNDSAHERRRWYPHMDVRLEQFVLPNYVDNITIAGGLWTPAGDGTCAGCEHGANV